MYAVYLYLRLSFVGKKTFQTTRLDTKSAARRHLVFQSPKRGSPNPFWVFMKPLPHRHRWIGFGNGISLCGCFGVAGSKLGRTAKSEQVKILDTPEDFSVCTKDLQLRADAVRIRWPAFNITPCSP
jgi:hypothetical protein